MFVAIYRWQLHPGQEEAFREGWRRVTELARCHCGSGGSALFRDGDGTWVAIARWASREARERCFAGGPLDAGASAQMLAATVGRLPDIELDGDTDLWGPLADDGPAGGSAIRLRWRACLDTVGRRLRAPRTSEVVGLSDHMRRDLGLPQVDAGRRLGDDHLLLPRWPGAR